MKPSKRRGTATVELAICLPLLVMLIFGGMEAANGIFLKQALTSAAYESAKMASTVGYTHIEAEARALEVLTSRGLQNAQIEIDPPITASTPLGTPITVTVSAPADLNAISPMVIHTSETSVKARVVMVRN